jgi:hypothetical protein
MINWQKTLEWRKAIMTKLKKDLQQVTRELKALTKKTERLTKAVDKLEKSKATTKAKPKRKTTAKKTTAKKKAPARKTTARKTTAKRSTAKKTPTKKKAPAKKSTAKASPADQVIKIIKRSKKGVHVADLMKKTGFGEGSVRNIVYKAAKAGKIKRAGRGVYAGA